MKRAIVALSTFVAMTCAPSLIMPPGAIGTPTVKPSPSVSPTKKPSATPSTTKRPSPSPATSKKPTPKPFQSATSKPSPTTTQSRKPSPSASPSKSPSPSASPSKSPTASPSPKPKPKPIVLPSTIQNPPARVSGVDTALQYAMLQTGKKYVLGGVGPNTFDCSGLVQTAWKKAGVTLPRTSGQQFAATIHIDLEDALPGDLIFFGQDGRQHVAIYIGFGLIVEAANSRKGVIISPINTSWHNQNFGGVGRVTKNPSLIRR